MVEAPGVGPKACVYLDELGVNPKPTRGMGLTAIKALNAARPSPRLKWRRRWRSDHCRRKMLFPGGNCPLGSHKRGRVRKIRLARVNSTNIRPA